MQINNFTGIVKLQDRNDPLTQTTNDCEKWIDCLNDCVKKRNYSSIKWLQPKIVQHRGEQCEGDYC